MSGQHTQGRLEYSASSRNERGEIQLCNLINVAGGEITPVARLLQPANARRLAACWNACEGVSTEGVEALVRVGGLPKAEVPLENLVAARALLQEVLDSGNATVAELCSNGMAPERETVAFINRIRDFLKGGAA